MLQQPEKSCVPTFKQLTASTTQDQIQHHLSSSFHRSKVRQDRSEAGSFLA